MKSTPERPLSGTYVLDFVQGSFATIGRTLAELGADVVRVEPPGGQKDRPAAEDRAAQIEFTVRNAGKRSIVIDRNDPADSARLAAMIERASVVLLDASLQAAFPIAPSDLLAKKPDLVVMSVSDFGTGNRFSGWSATDPVLHALSGELAGRASSGASRCCRRRASAKAPRPRRVPMRRCCRSTMLVAPGGAGTSIFPPSTASARRSIRASVSAAVPPPAPAPATCRAAVRRGVSSTPSSSVVTAMCASAFCRRGNGNRCSPGWGAPKSSPIPNTTSSTSAFLRRRSTRPSRLSSRGKAAASSKSPGNGQGCPSAPCSPSTRPSRQTRSRLARRSQPSLRRMVARCTHPTACSSSMAIVRDRPAVPRRSANMAALSVARRRRCRPPNAPTIGRLRGFVCWTWA